MQGRARLWGIFAWIAIAGLTAPAQATSFINRPLKAVVDEAPFIVRGQTLDSYTDWGKGDLHGSIFTYTNFDVTEVIKGKLDEKRITLRQPGGAKDGIEMHVPGAAGFSREEDIVVLLSSKNADDGSYDVPGLITGKYNVREKDGQTVLENSMGGGGMIDPGRDPRTQSYSSTITLAEFRKVAHGQDVPLAKAKQFEASNNAPAAGAFESEHHHDEPKAAASSSPATAVEPPPEERSSWWMPASFAALVIAGAWFLYRMIAKGGKA